MSVEKQINFNSVPDFALAMSKQIVIFKFNEGADFDNPSSGFPPSINIFHEWYQINNSTYMLNMQASSNVGEENEFYPTIVNWDTFFVNYNNYYETRRDND